MDNTAEMDPWASMGNTTNSKAGEISPEGLAREATWNNAMTNAPEFNSNQPGESDPSTLTIQSEANNEAPNRDENIADASAILNYGLNAAARERGVEATIQAINNFVPSGEGNPIQQLFIDLGIDTGAEFRDLADESRAAKPAEIAFRNESVNAPTTTRRSPEGAMSAIKEVKELVAEVQTSPAYANLREEAIRFNKGIFEYAVYKYGVRDLTTLFNSLSEQKSTYEKSLNQKPAPEDENPKNEEPQDNSTPNETNQEESNPDQEKPTIEEPSTEKLWPKETQIGNQSSTINPSPDTEAAAIEKSLL